MLLRGDYAELCHYCFPSALPFPCPDPTESFLRSRLREGPRLPSIRAPQSWPLAAGPVLPRCKGRGCSPWGDGPLPSGRGCARSRPPSAGLSADFLIGYSLGKRCAAPTLAQACRGRRELRDARGWGCGAVGQGAGRVHEAESPPWLVSALGCAGCPSQGRGSPWWWV